MNILFVSKSYAPNIGGVEIHLQEISKILMSQGHKVTIITEKYNTNTKSYEHLNGVEIYRIKYPHIKYLGVLNIWMQLFNLRGLIQKSDTVHIHDVFVWYLPFRFLFPSKKVYTTFHGWEGKYPIPFINKVQKKIAWKLSTGTIAVGNYINKWYGIKSDYVIHGAFEGKRNKKVNKISNSYVYAGRLEKDTGLIDFLNNLEKQKDKINKVDFVGDGELRYLCEKYGTVCGFTDSIPFIERAEYCIPGGWLAYWQARYFNCKIITFADNPLKADTWSEIKRIKGIPKWKDIAEVYLKLWQKIK